MPFTHSAVAEAVCNSQWKCYDEDSHYVCDCAIGSIEDGITYIESNQ
jgi:3-oxoacyl-(acyl-carrier-protein) synthase